MKFDTLPTNGERKKKVNLVSNGEKEKIGIVY
jgi:hypothetical protein